MSKTLGKPQNGLWENTLSPLRCGGRLRNREGEWTGIKTNLFLYQIGFLMPGSNTLLGATLMQKLLLCTWLQLCVLICMVGLENLKYILVNLVHLLYNVMCHYWLTTRQQAFLKKDWGTTGLFKRTGGLFWDSACVCMSARGTYKWKRRRNEFSCLPQLLWFGPESQQPSNQRLNKKTCIQNREHDTNRQSKGEKSKPTRTTEKYISDWVRHKTLWKS